MALGVIGAVDEEAADGGGESFAADGAGLGEVEVGIGGEGVDAGEGGVQAPVEFAEKIGFGGGWIALGLERGELGLAELAAFGIGEEAVEAAGDVAQVEGDGSYAGGAGVEGGFGKLGEGSVDVFTGELEGMDDGAEDGREAGVGAAEPGFHDRLQVTAGRDQG